MPVLTTPTVPAGTLSGGPQPTLGSTGGLVLRPWHPDDVPILVAAYADPPITRWHARTMTTDEAADWVRERHDGWQAESRADWAVVRADRVVGRVGLRVLDLAEGEADVAYWVLPDARGTGVASQSVEALARWAFEDVGLARLTLHHSTGNEASCAVARRCGFTLEGTARSAAVHADGRHDMHVHARLTSDGPTG